MKQQPPKNLHLETLKPGTPITILRPKNGEWKPFGRFQILDWNGRVNHWRYTRVGSSCVCGSIRESGGGFDFMSRSKEPDFFISANPAHVKAGARSAEVAARKAIREKTRREAKEAAALAAFQKELSALLLKYGAEIYSEQVSGDDQGVEFETRVSIGSTSATLNP